MSAPEGPASGPKLAKSGVLRIATVVSALLVTAALFFAGAGTWNVPSGWYYFGALLAYLLAAAVVAVLFFPGVAEVINERGRVKKDVKRWDKAIALANVALMLAQPIVAGVDVGRLHCAAVPLWLCLLATFASVASYLLAHWAMVVNRFAETGVRIQSDRHHEVVTSGPYRFVRHPFYASMGTTQLLFPIALGSVLAYVPTLLIVALLVWRTALEDRTLRRELPGYEEFAARTRYRLIPFVW